MRARMSINMFGLVAVMAVVSALTTFVGTPLAGAQQQPSLDVQPWMPRYRYTREQQRLANSPELQARARQALETGINDGGWCTDRHVGDQLYHYEWNTGTDPKGYWYVPICPQGHVVYLWYDPRQGPKYWTVGSTDTWQAPQQQAALDPSFNPATFNWMDPANYDMHYEGNGIYWVLRDRAARAFMNKVRQNGMTCQKLIQLSSVRTGILYIPNVSPLCH